MIGLTIARVGRPLLRASALSFACCGLVACTAAMFQQAAQQIQAPALASFSAQMPAADMAATVPPAPASASTTVAFSPPEIRAKPHEQLGQPYEIAGNWYTPQHDPGYDQTGPASWYGEAFRGQLTANGEVFDDSALTAAHPTLPLPSYARVTNTANSRSVLVRINDRGPFSNQRLIDVSARTAELLDFKRTGVAQVRVEYVSPARLDGDDSAFLLASYRAPGGTSAPTTMLASATPRPRPFKPATSPIPVVLAALPAAPAAPAPAAPPAPIRAAARPVAVASGAPFDPFQTLSDTRTLWSPVAFSPADGFKPQPSRGTGASASSRSSFAPDRRVSAAFEAISGVTKR